VGYPFQGSVEENPSDVRLVFNTFLVQTVAAGKARGAELQNFLIYHDCSTIEVTQVLFG